MKLGLSERNPAAVVAIPRVETYENRPFTPAEARTFLGAIKGDRLEALYTVALTMGLRQGEALGLRWRDVDLELGYLRVTKQLQRLNGRSELVEPKTSRSRRQIEIPMAVTRASVSIADAKSSSKGRPATLEPTSTWSSDRRGETARRDSGEHGVWFAKSCPERSGRSSPRAGQFRTFRFRRSELPIGSLPDGSTSLSICTWPTAASSWRAAPRNRAAAGWPSRRAI